MFIEKLAIEITTTTRKKFSRRISFIEDTSPKEIGLIFGENTLGKTTTIKTIIYALGGEDLYGKSSWNETNFPPIMRRINSEEIIENWIFLQILNKKNERVIIRRNTLDREDSIKIYYDSDIKDINNAKYEYFKIKKDRGIQGAKTFQEFLFKFLSIPLYEHQEPDGEKYQIYFQNLMPLFIIPQIAWGDIQSSNPSYNIPEVKKVAFEILLNLSDIKNLDDKIKLKELNYKLRQKRQALEEVNKVLSTAVFKSSSDIEQEQQNIEEQLRFLKVSLEEIEKGKIEKNVEISPLKDNFRNLSYMAKKLENQIRILDKEINEYNYYINKINLDIEKIDKLKTAKRLISFLPIEKCPHCLNEVEINEFRELETSNCDLCGSTFITKNYSKDEQILSYLSDEKKDFLKIKNKKEIEKTELDSKLYILKLDLKECEKSLEEIEYNLQPKSLKEYQYYSREIGRLSNRVSVLNKEKDTIQRYEVLLKSIDDTNDDIKQLRKKLASLKSEVEDSTKLEFFQKKFKSILSELDFLKDGFDGKDLDLVKNEYFNKIIIDEDDYKPKIEGRNLYNITSSSGFIRIIISYYLALLETCLHYEAVTYHPFILIFDEPRQQNLDIGTYNKFTDYLINLRKNYSNKFQVIFASGSKGTLTEDQIVLDLGTDEYLIQPM